MEYSFNVEFQFRNHGKQYLDFKTTDGISWIMYTERRHSMQKGIRINVMFDKLNNQDKCYSISLKINSEEDTAVGTFELVESVNSYRTKFVISLGKLFRHFNFIKPNIESSKSNKFHYLAKLNFRINVIIRSVEPVDAKPVVRVSVSNEVFSKQMCYLLSSGKFHDIEIADDTSIMKLHRCILFARWEFIKDLLMEDRFAYTGEPVNMRLNDMEGLEQLWCCIYSGRIRPMRFTLTQRIFKMGRNLNAPNLMKACCTVLKYYVSLYTVCATLIAAHFCEIPDLKEYCRQFLQAQLDFVKKYDSDWTKVSSMWNELFQEIGN